MRYSHPTFRCGSFYIKTAISPCSKYIASGSSDSNLYIWEVDAPNRLPFVLRGHISEVTSAQWCMTRRDGVEQIATCSDDATVRIWNVRGAEAEQCREEEMNGREGWGFVTEG